MRLAVTLAMLLSATAAHADEVTTPEPPDKAQVCEAENARLRAALDQLARLLARLGVEAQGAAEKR